MCLTPFFKAFLVTADVPEIYMQELWATATVHHHSIWFKMENKKHIVNLESFGEMLHIFPRLPHQPFVEPPFEEEILAFLCFLGHSGVIRKLTDVNINKMHQPCRSFAAIINKCLTGKSLGYDSLRLSQAQILSGLYHTRNVDFAYLMWEDFIYQVEHKDTKKSNEMCYPRFTKVIIHHFMSKDPSIPRRNKVNWHYVRDDYMNSNAYKEYYKVATGVTPPKPKASVRKNRSSFDTTVTPLTAAAGQRLSTSAKGKQPAKASKAKSLSALSEVAMTEAQQLKLATKRSLQQTYISQASGSGTDEGTGFIPGVPDEDEGDDEEDDEEEGGDDEQASNEEEFIHPISSTHAEEETMDEESFDPISKTPKNKDDEDNDEENLETNIGRDEGQDEEDEADELYIDQSSSVSSQFVTSMLNPTPDAGQRTSQGTVSKILPMIKQTVNEQLEAEVLTRSSNSSKTSYAIAANLSEMDLKKILIEKIEGNKSIHRSNEQRNLYKALVDAYESDTIILDTYEDTVMLKRHRDDDADRDEEPFAGSDQGSKRHREGKEPESASAPTKKATRSTGKSTQGSKSRQTSASESAVAEEPMQTTFKMEEPSHPEFVQGSCKSLVELEFFLEEVYKTTTDQLDWVNLEGASSRKYTTSVTKTKAADYGYIKWIEDLFYDFAVNRESAHDVYSKRRIIVVTKLKIVEWHNYKHLDWITVRRDDDKLYKFREGDFKSLRIQDIEDMLLLLVQGKLTNLTVEELFAFNISLRMFTRSIVI
nr:hypothetical protein [Tanacetum cinerariifolium]